MSIIKCMSDDLFTELRKDVISRNDVCAILSKLRYHHITVDMGKLSATIMNNMIVLGKYDPGIFIDFIRFFGEITRNDQIYLLFILFYFQRSIFILFYFQRSMTIGGSRMVFRAFFHHGVVPHVKSFFNNGCTTFRPMSLHEHELYACLGEFLDVGRYDLEEDDRMTSIWRAGIGIRQVETTFYISRLVEY